MFGLQVKYLMGLKVPRFDRLQDTMRNLAQNLGSWNWREYVVRIGRLAGVLVSVHTHRDMTLRCASFIAPGLARLPLM